MSVIKTDNIGTGDKVGNDIKYKHSKLMTNEEAARLFIAQLKLTKKHNSDDMKIGDDYYSEEHFKKTVKEKGIKLTDDEMEEIMEDIMDIQQSIEYGKTLISDHSVKECIYSIKSETARKFLHLLKGQNYDDYSNEDEDELLYDGGKRASFMVTTMGGTDTDQGNNYNDDGKGILVTMGAFNEEQCDKMMKFQPIFETQNNNDSK